MTTNDNYNDGTERLEHWQECEMPECSNDVPTAKGICDECAGGAR